jgi:hypothetical protein
MKLRKGKLTPKDDTGFALAPRSWLEYIQVFYIKIGYILSTWGCTRQGRLDERMPRCPAFAI